MKLQGRNLRVRMEGKDVKLLQSELSQIGYSINDKKGFFGEATARQGTTPFIEYFSSHLHFYYA